MLGYDTVDGTWCRDYVDVSALSTAHLLDATLLDLEVIQPDQHEIFNLPSGRSIKGQRRP